MLLKLDEMMAEAVPSIRPYRTDLRRCGITELFDTLFEYNISKMISFTSILSFYTKNSSSLCHQKKVLALVLAFACAFTMFAGAAFTDQADISQTEAVDMLSALGVINGYTDGSFKPDATITRAEAAKMIYTIWNGGNDDASAFEWKSQFTDVYSGHWAEGYINFCYTNGIINGLSTTQFGPNDAVTGTQLAKMLLICMGYQADKSGLEGTGYSQRTNALATQNGLYVDVAASVSAAMPRQYAAQMMYNALKADTVIWSTDNNAYSKVSSIGFEWNGSRLEQITVYETMGKKCMGLDTIEKVTVQAVEKENNRDTFTVKTDLNNDFSRVTTDYSDLVGMKVNVMIKDGDYSKVYGMYADEDCAVLATGVVGQLATDDNNTFKLAGTAYDTDGTVATTNVYTMNDDTSYTSAQNLRAIALNNNNTDHNDAFGIKLIDIDNDAKVDYAVMTPVYVAKVTYVNSDGIRIDSSKVNTDTDPFAIDTAYDYADHTIADDIARDEWVVITAADYTVDGKAVINKADVVSGTVNAVHTGTAAGMTGVTEVRVDGTWYKTAETVDAADRDTTAGNEVDLVTYGGMYYSVDGSVGALDVAVVTGVGDWKNLDKAREVRLMFQDGSEEVVTVEKWYTLNSDTNGNNIMEASELNNEAIGAGATSNAMGMLRDLVSYEIDDGKYTLTTVADGMQVADTDYKADIVNSGTAFKYNDDNKTIETGSATYDIDDGAMVVIENRDGDYIYMTGADLMNRNGITFTVIGTDGETGYVITDTDGVVVAMYAKTMSTITSGAKQYGYIVDTMITNDGSGNVLTIDVITADGLIEEQVTDQDKVGTFATGDVISYTMDGDVMVISKETNLVYGAIQTNTADRVRFHDGSRYSITEDTVVIAIKDSGTSDADFEGNSLVNAQNANHLNAIYATDGGDLTVIFVDVDNAVDLGGDMYDFGKVAGDPQLSAGNAKDTYTP